MMDILITSIKLTNFKCFAHLQLDFTSDITTIYGRNGSGKTTIADAILFCLFGKNTAGQSDLELFKTRSDDGNIIPNIDHAVQLSLSLGDGKDVTLCRSIKEVWVKKRGSDENVFKNNTVEYYVNGESYTKADYESYISGIINEQLFRILTNPEYFSSLKWQQKREFLVRLAGETPKPTDDDLIAALADRSLEDYLKHLSYQIKEIKKKLDKIPVRLEEQNKALPQCLDWTALQASHTDTTSQLKALNDQIIAIRQGNGADLQRNELKGRLRVENDKHIAREQELQEEYSKEYMAQRKQVNELTARFNLALNNQRLMEQTIEADKRLIERCSDTDYEAELQKLREQWPSSRFNIDPDLRFCPTCGQAIPDDQYQEKVEQMKANFNLNREAKIKELNAKAAQVKKQQADAAEQLKSLQQKLNDDQSQLAAIKDDINRIFAQKAGVEKKQIKDVATRMEEDAQAKAIRKKIASLQEQLDSIQDSDENSQRLSELQEQSSQLAETLVQLTSQLATKQQYDRIQSLIASIDEEEKSLVEQLSTFERMEDKARAFQSEANKMIEERINQHFHLVQWRLFRTVNNSGDPFEEPYCECYVDGIPYGGGLNQAARLNAGLDICNALSNYYGVSAPLVIDNAESTLDIIHTAGQQIRLYVKDCELTLQ